MPLYLDEKEIALIRQYVPKTDWYVNKGLHEKLDYNDKVKAERTTCDHVTKSFTGKKTCCIKCGVLGEGEGIEWTRDN
jgi:hypothetical protein